MRNTGPKNKLARREGTDLNLKTAGTKSHASLLRRMKIRPGQHGQKMRRKMSDYGRQLREKQKVRAMYGIIEHQFRRYYDRASRFHGVTGEELLRQLERRLDNVLYRMGFTPTRAAARQLVSHGHILVNDRTVNVASFQVRVGDVVRLTDRTVKIPMIAAQLNEKTQKSAEWVDIKGTAGKILTLPKRNDIPEDIDEQLIVEYYSR